MAEVNQIYTRNWFEPITVKDITTSERRKYCDAIMLFTENNNGHIKGIAVFNGEYSRVWNTKEDTASPTA